MGSSKVCLSCVSSLPFYPRSSFSLGFDLVIGIFGSCFLFFLGNVASKATDFFNPRFQLTVSSSFDTERVIDSCYLNVDLFVIDVIVVGLNKLP